MATDTGTRVGRFVWHDCMTGDVDRAKAFYGDLLGWHIEVWKPGEMDYPMISSGGAMHGGFGPAPEGAPPHWLGHVQVEDLEATLERVRANGGTVLAGPFEVPEVGRMAPVADPQGAVLSVFQPAGEIPPSEGVFVWDELVVDDVDAAKAYYSAVLGWTTGEMEGAFGTYTMVRGASGTDAAGILPRPPNMPAGGPAFWLAYLGTADVDATAARATELGGTVMAEPFDIPGVGRIAILADPTGAAFGLFQPSR
jgi:predicted enzyme related to lactoylglutathione lyase